MSDRLKGNDRDLLNWVNRYYPPGAAKVRLEVASEYNDETYDNTVVYAAVLDANGDEMAPLPGKANESRKVFRGMDLHYMDETKARTEDYEVILGSGL